MTDRIALEIARAAVENLGIELALIDARLVAERNKREKLEGWFRRLIQEVKLNKRTLGPTDRAYIEAGIVEAIIDEAQEEMTAGLEP